MAEPPKTQAEWRSMTEEQLLLEAQTGLRGLGAVIEMSRRQLHDAQHQTMRRLTWLILGCAFVTLLTMWYDMYLRHGSPIKPSINTTPLIPSTFPPSAPTPKRKEAPKHEVPAKGGDDGTTR